MDTGAWYALVDADDPDHGRLAPCFREHRGRLITSNFVFDEAITLTRYRLGWPVASRLGAQLRTGQVALVERVTSIDEDAAWAIFSSYRDKSFSFTDCTSFVVMRELKLQEVLTTDHHFSQAGFLTLPT